MSELSFPPPREVALGALRAMATVARADGTLAPSEQRLLETVAEALGVGDVAVEALEPVTPEALRETLREAVERERVVQALILTAMVDEKVEASELLVVERFARGLEVSEPRVRNLRQFAEGRLRTLWLDLARRSFAKPLFEKALRERGLGGLYKIVGPMVGLAQDPELARRYNDLGTLEEGSLGRAYWEFIVKNELGFPGEGVVSEEGVWHDLTHVLAGYGTDPAGEVQVVSFIAGYRRDDPFFWLFTIALQFHLAVKVSPYSPGLRGHFDPPLVLRALARGAQVRRDLSAWDYWPDMPRPLAELRAELGVPPP